MPAKTAACSIERPVFSRAHWMNLPNMRAQTPWRDCSSAAGDERIVRLILIYSLLLSGEPCQARLDLNYKLTMRSEGDRTKGSRRARAAGTNINQQLIDQGYGQYREDLGGPAAQAMFGKRGQGPDYIQYEKGGPVRYELSALATFIAAHRIRPTFQARPRRRRQP
jgi:hypothetical protein